VTLVGTLNCGGRVERIKTCEAEGSPANSPNQWDCGEPAIYRVTFKDGGVLHVCEEHCEQMWERDEASGVTK
jgi:hypothetical protein